MQIIPSMLTQTRDEFFEQLNAVQGSVDMIQIDIADGLFVPNMTWSNPEEIGMYLIIDCELHLMVENPLEEIEKWEDVDQVKRVYFHFDAVGPDESENILKVIQANNWQAGIVLNPDTPIEMIEPLLPLIDAVMFMGVHPGFQGQDYIPETTKRMRDFKSRYKKTFVALDGAVNMQTLPDIITSRIDAICPGSAIFRNEKTPANNVETMNELINRLT